MQRNGLQKTSNTQEWQLYLRLYAKNIKMHKMKLHGNPGADYVQETQFFTCEKLMNQGLLNF